MQSDGRRLITQRKRARPATIGPRHEGRQADRGCRIEVQVPPWEDGGPHRNRQPQADHPEQPPGTARTATSRAPPRTGSLASTSVGP